MAMVIDNAFDIGQSVYLKSDADQLLRIVTRFMVSKNDVIYELYCGTGSSWHYAFECSTERNMAMKLNTAGEQG